MSNFQIIAIRTGQRRSNRNKLLNPLKILKEETVYPLSSDFNFPNEDFSFILKNNDTPNLYSIRNKIPINICSIVGKNGSGKSTLVELLYWASYNIGCCIKLLRDRKHGKLLLPYNMLNMEILYSTTEDDYYIITIAEKRIFSQRLILKGDELVSIGSPEEITDVKNLDNYFYSVVINYSHHALNSFEIGDWINSLFHKNDGYQTPIVLNPMRDDGIIDINRENRLLKRRLLANILEPVKHNDELNSMRNLADNKVVKKLKLSYSKVSKKSIGQSKSKYPELRKQVLVAIEKYFQISIDEKALVDNYFINACLEYIIEKLIKVSRTYRPFQKFRNDNNSILPLKYINAYIKLIYESSSHIIFKVKGAILYLKYYKELLDVEDFRIEDELEIDINRYSENIAKITKLHNIFVNTSILGPPPIFDVDIILKDNISLETLSSGEKQRIHSISSIAYHLIFLNSVNNIVNDEGDSDQYQGYKYINLVLDEIELYYHPEWQRKYLDDLLKYIGRISSANLNNIKGINIIVLTHSPYILSDIPTSKIARMNEGKIEAYETNEKTFGANIHDLLTQSFFMDSVTGEFALSKTREIIELYRKVREYSYDENNIAKVEDLKGEYWSKQDSFKFIIKNIGEDVLKGMLQNHIIFIEEALNINKNKLNYDDYL